MRNDGGSIQDVDPSVATEATGPEQGFIEAFARMIEDRRMDDALRLFEDNREAVANLSPCADDAALLVNCCARLLDRDDAHLPLVEDLFARFDAKTRSSLRWIDCALLDIAEGIIAFYRDQDFERARARFELVAQNAARNGAPQLVLPCQYYMARCCYRVGKYEDALLLTRNAKQHLMHPRAIAQIEMVEAWTLFVQGRLPEAAEVLDHAASSFGFKSAEDEDDLGDYVEACNILSFRGRIEREQGNYESACELFQKAAEKFRKHHDQRHHVLARILVQLAIAQLLSARELAERKSTPKQRKDADLKVMALQEQAAENLRMAFGLYNALDHYRGLASVHNFRAWLHLDRGEFRIAEREAQRAYRIAEQKRFTDAKTHALITQCLIEREYGEPVRCLSFGKQALECAVETDRRRLNARAHIALGRALVKPPFTNVAEARRHLDEANKLLQPSDRDYVRSEFEEFQEELNAAKTQERYVIQLTLNEILADGLEGTLRKTERTLVRHVLRLQGGAIQRAAVALRTTRNRIRRSVH